MDDLNRNLTKEDFLYLLGFFTLFIGSGYLIGSGVQQPVIYWSARIVVVVLMLFLAFGLLFRMYVHRTTMLPLVAGSLALFYAGALDGTVLRRSVIVAAFALVLCGAINSAWKPIAEGSSRATYVKGILATFFKVVVLMVIYAYMVLAGW